MPKFSDHDVETFLISFDKVAELNNFLPDKYAAILQARLTGKASEVFTELFVLQHLQSDRPFGANTKLFLNLLI